MMIPVSLLAAPHAETALNRQLPKLEVIVPVLCCLSEMGAIVFERDGVMFPPKEPDVKAAISEVYNGPGSNTIYGLTKIGRKRWEEGVKHDWRSFVDLSANVDSQGRVTAGVFAGLDPDSVQKAFRDYQQHEDTDATVDRWERHAPWEATYWKTLPSGRLLFFKGRRGTEKGSGVPC